MAVNLTAAAVASKLHKQIPSSSTEQAFALYAVQQEIKQLEELALALGYWLSFAEDNTIAHGPDFDLLIETLGTASKVRLVRHVK